MLHKLKISFPDIQIFFVFLICFVFSSIFVPHFFSPANLSSLMVQVAPLGIVAIGMTFIIITAGIDLSVGSQVAVISILFAGNGHEPFSMMLLSCLFWGVACGLVNGLLIGKATISPFISTLSTMAIFRGLALYLSNSEEKRIYDPTFGDFSFLTIGGVPIAVIVFVLFVIVGQILLKRTIFGLRVAAIGSSHEASQFVGIRVNQVRMIVYTLSGFLCAVGAFFITARLNTAAPSLGEFYELDAIAAVIIGGTNLFGGSGSVVGTFFGILIFGLITNILNLTGTSPHFQRIVKGLVILIAVYAQSEQFSQFAKSFKIKAKQV